VSASFVNDGVTGSNPVCGTSKINHLAEFRGSAETAYVCIVSANALRIRGFAMSDELDWNFVDRDDAKAEIRAAVEYLLRGTTGGARGDIVQEIQAIVRDVANGRRPDPLDDDMPGG
jgi:hypothetical protein